MRYKSLSLSKSEVQRIILFRNYSKIAQLLASSWSSLDRLNFIPEHLAKSYAEEVIDWPHFHDQLIKMIHNSDQGIISFFDKIINHPFNTREQEISYITIDKMIIEFLQRLSNSSLRLEEISFLYFLNNIATNPVGMTHTSTYKKIIELLKQVQIISNAFVPFTATAFARTLWEKAAYKQYDFFKKALFMQQKNNLELIDSGWGFNAFGHQVQYGDLAFKINSIQNELQYRLLVDRRTVANLPLLNHQIDSGFPIQLIDLVKCEPHFLRAWDIRFIMLPDESKSESNYLQRTLIVAAPTINKIYYQQNINDVPHWTYDSHHLEIPNDLRSFFDLTKGENFICASWRTDAFKNEFTDFNHHRNSNEFEVVTALDRFSRSLKVHVYIICLVSDLSAIDNIRSNPYLHFYNDFENLTEESYAFLLKQCSIFFTGPSGCQSAGALLFGKPTLIFDYPWHGDFGEPYIFVLHKKVKYKNRYISLPETKQIMQSIPLNGISIRAAGIEFEELDSNTLEKSFTTFYSNFIKHKDIFSHDKILEKAIEFSTYLSINNDHRIMSSLHQF